MRASRTLNGISIPFGPPRTLPQGHAGVGRESVELSFAEEREIESAMSNRHARRSGCDASGRPSTAQRAERHRQLKLIAEPIGPMGI
jgi:hypothetical protein